MRLETEKELERQSILSEAREEIAALERNPTTQTVIKLMFVCSVIVDVVGQGWRVNCRRGKVVLEAPNFATANPDEIKKHIRDGHILERDAQLREESVREFIRSMEQRRLGRNGWHSIFSLMRDGRELAAKMDAAAAVEVEAERVRFLKQAIFPYLQIVEAGSTCEHTGLNLSDVWRYFRHTWVNTYRMVPGRSMMLLVRDAAAPNHPVIGIGALGNSMAQQTIRDEWIGWEPEVFLRKIEEKPQRQTCRWLLDSIDRLIEAIYRKDLLRDGLISASVIAKPNRGVIESLRQEAKNAAEQHRLFPNAAETKKITDRPSIDEIDWEKQAQTHLFRCKRVRTLAQLLQIRLTLQSAGLAECSIDPLKAVLASAQGREAIRQIVRMVKAEHVGVDMLDIVVCGAIAPYNELLGGKLICLLLTAPNVVKYYRSRYGHQPSIIASSMRGAPVVRSPNLVLLATTSLYGVGSSQYNRIRVPLETVGGRRGKRIEYIELGESKGFGSYHFSQPTLKYLEAMLGRAGNGRKVNSIFGEGVNPLMRKIRHGLDMVQLPSNDLLRHRNKRVVYGIPLADNFREILLGIDSRPNYLLSSATRNGAITALAEFWTRRWLSNRIRSKEVLAAVQKHSLSYPILHGARVILPLEEESL
jgi:hypothetical protein